MKKEDSITTEERHRRTSPPRTPIPPEVIEASNQHRMKIDAMRYRWMKLHPAIISNWQFVKTIDKDNWIDEQMRKNP